jgi:tetratricopeptide (TPR) repeat protein
MKVKSMPSPVLSASLALSALLLSCALNAQETGDASPATDEADELQPIVLENSRHIANPEFTDDIPEDIDKVPAPPETTDDRLRRLFTLYKDAVAQGSFAEADTLAKRIVEISISENGRDSEESARALTNLAIAQHGMADFESAQINFKTSIEIIERIKDRLDASLINPLKGLGASQLAAGRADLATPTFQRAVHVSHVNNGPHNLMQVELLDSLAETYLAAGDAEDALNMQERIFNLQARNLDADSEDMLPALLNQVRWQHRLELYDKERYTWRRIISILEHHRGNKDVSLISPLTGLGKSYLYFAPADVSYQQPTINSTGEIYLKRALRIAEENPDADWTVRSKAMLALADYYILADKPNRASRAYREIWEFLSGDEERLKSRHDELETLQVLQTIRPPQFYGVDAGPARQRQPDGFETGTVVYEYAISARGRTTDIELVDIQPAGLDDMQRSVERELRQLVQRPRVVDGDTVQTDKLTYTHNFFYRASDVDQAEDDSESLAENIGK